MEPATDTLDPLTDSIEAAPIESRYDDENDENDANTPSTSRGRRHFITSRLVAALDNAKVTDGMAIHIIIAVAEALGHNVNELVINRTTLRELRQKNREEESNSILAAFEDDVIGFC